MRRRRYLAGLGATALGGVAATGRSGADTVDRTPEAAALTIAPGTALLFEVLDDGIDPGDVEWEPDDLPGGPMTVDFPRAIDGDARSFAFEDVGEYTVSAGLGDETVDWTVTVDEDGDEPPDVETIASDPDSEATIGVDDSVTIETEVADPAGELDRVVWIEDRNETVLAIDDDVDGEFDTSSIAFDEAPAWIGFGYSTSAVPIAADGRLGDGGSVDGLEVRQPFALEIVGTNAPVAAGDELSVDVAVENVGDMMMVGPNSQALELVVGDETVDDATVTLDWAESTTLTLGYETYPVSRDVRFPVRVVGEDDEDEREVEVTADESDDSDATGTLAVSIADTNAPVAGGEFLEVLVEVANDGPGDASGSIDLDVGGEVVDSQTVDLPEAGTQTLSLGYETYPVAQDVTVSLTVESPHDTDSTTVPVDAAE